MKNKQIIDSPGITVSFLSSSPAEPRELSICHDRYELLFVSSGHGRYILECEELPIATGSLFIAKPFEYRTLLIDEKSELDRCEITFDKSLLSAEALEILENLLSVGGARGVYYPESLSGSEIEAVFDRFYIAERLPEKEGGAFARALLSELLILLSAVSGERLLRREENLAGRVARYINANIQRDLSLDRLSHRFFVSKYYLCRAFKQQSGTSIHNYINQKRVLYAKQLIEAGETASSAADKVGFRDYSSFYRAYTKYQGASPMSVKPKGGEL